MTTEDKVLKLKQEINTLIEYHAHVSCNHRKVYDSNKDSSCEANRQIGYEYYIRSTCHSAFSEDLKQLLNSL